MFSGIKVVFYLMFFCERSKAIEACQNYRLGTKDSFDTNVLSHNLCDAIKGLN